MKTSYIIPTIKIKGVYLSRMMAGSVESTMHDGDNTISTDDEITTADGFASKRGYDSLWEEDE